MSEKGFLGLVRALRGRSREFIEGATQFSAQMPGIAAGGLERGNPVQKQYDLLVRGSSILVTFRDEISLRVALILM
jgi:hypothetical protein